MNKTKSPPAWLRRLATVGAMASMLSLAPAWAHDAALHAAAWSGGNDYHRSMRAYAVPDVVLTNAQAKPVRLRDLLATDKPVMLNFVFTTCSTICPVMVRVFADVPSRLGSDAKDLQMISISIDPENDTPERLKAYGEAMGSGQQWHFLTGRADDIKAVQQAFDTYRGDKMAHEPLTLIRSARSKSWLRIDGFANPDELVSEYRHLKMP